MRTAFDLGVDCSPLAAGELGENICNYICDKRRVIKRTNCPKSVITKIAEVDAPLTVVGPGVTVVDARLDDGPDIWSSQCVNVLLLFGACSFSAVSIVNTLEIPNTTTFELWRLEYCLLEHLLEPARDRRTINNYER